MTVDSAIKILFALDMELHGVNEPYSETNRRGFHRLCKSSWPGDHRLWPSDHRLCRECTHVLRLLLTNSEEARTAAHFAGADFLAAIGDSGGVIGRLNFHPAFQVKLDELMEQVRE